jgi:hypothetical protein
METPPPYSPAAKRWLRHLIGVRNAAVNLANTAEPHAGSVQVARTEFRRMIVAINRLMEFEESLPD